ncbi:MAG: adenylyl-sulfate reductase subunit alpha [Thermodesulfovibrionales bacterium]|jgi:adenylylsulfate reductase subunit A|nr:adenylyl-sulfate reductase subunit alpha [Thermodesulfovibrionales bacterium]
MKKSLPRTIKDVEEVRIETDLLIIGGGNSGCFVAIEAKEKNPNLDVTIMEKAHIDRSGALAAGMDAINTYIGEGETPETIVAWSRAQVGGGPLREDLALSNAKILNECVESLEKWGVPFKKDEKGKYKRRGRFDISIHGEQLKPVIAEKTKSYNPRILNRVAATNLIKDGDRVVGAMGFGIRDGKFYVIKAKATVVSTGGAAGLYRSATNDGTTSHHQMWMCPFNVGTGYAMGIRAGAEFTLMEQRWCAARVKDFTGPVDTISVGYKARMINSKGELILQERYSHLGGDAAPRYIRANAPMGEWSNGRGPTYVDTRHLSPEQVKDLKIDYLNERPTYVLFLAARGQDPAKEPLEIYGSDPYIVGGHTASGYWVDIDRMATIPGLFAAGECAGGMPNKFVGGCAAEGVLAARGALKYISSVGHGTLNEDQIAAEKERVFSPLLRGLGMEARYNIPAGQDPRWQYDGVTPEEMEERFQRLMDEYAGGVGQFFKFNEEQLNYALKHIKMMRDQVNRLFATDLHDLVLVHDVIDRLDVAEVVVMHLRERRETRWPGWQTRTDYPDVDPNLDCFINSRKNLKTGEIEMIKRPYEQILPGDRTKAPSPIPLSAEKA